MAEHIKDFLGRLNALKQEGTPVVAATVVARLAPVSSHLGDRALVFTDGRMEGFVGGACSREIIRKQALEALSTGKPRLVKIRPDVSVSDPYQDSSSVVVPMTCASEGAADVYIEPHLPPRLLLVVGYTPVASVLSQLAQALEYRVVRVVEPNEARDAAQAGVEVVPLPQLSSFVQKLSPTARAQMAAVVASQGHYDEAALEVLFKAGAGYIGLLASRKRAANVKVTLEELAKIPARDLERLKNPVGLDIGAKTPGEVAVSILAEVVQFKPQSAPQAEGLSPVIELALVAPEVPVLPFEASAKAIDPVCGMEVEVATAQHVAELEGQTYYFCCPHCKARFLKTPEKYLSQTSAS